MNREMAKDLMGISRFNFILLTDIFYELASQIVLLNESELYLRPIEQPLFVSSQFAFGPDEPAELSRSPHDGPTEYRCPFNVQGLVGGT